MTDPSVGTMLVLPWQRGVLAEWSIVGMNHYHADGRRRLFVALTRQGRCIQAEGDDEPALWDELARQAAAVGKALERGTVETIDLNADAFLAHVIVVDEVVVPATETVAGGQSAPGA